jgi:hypothetical protein
MASRAIDVSAGVSDTCKGHFGALFGYLATSGEVRLSLENKDFSGFRRWDEENFESSASAIPPLRPMSLSYRVCGDFAILGIRGVSAGVTRQKV